jgi:hypothetical protein
MDSSCCAPCHVPAGPACHHEFPIGKYPRPLCAYSRQQAAAQYLQVGEDCLCLGVKLLGVGMDGRHQLILLNDLQGGNKGR